MILKVAMPGKVQFKLIRREPAFFMAHEGDIHYIGGADVLPAPLETEQENEVIQDLATEEYAQEARSILIEHNLRLVVYIAKKFDNTGVGVEDLISIGTIGLIKSINTFNPGKNIKLATYASRCIENEILMYLRRNHKTRMEVSIDEPLNVDWDGNELLLSDILGTDEDVIYRDMENEAERRILRNAVAKLSERERTIVSLRFGLDTPDGQEMTQKEVAAYLGISQSYISRLEKKIMKRLKKRWCGSEAARCSCVRPPCLHAFRDVLSCREILTPCVTCSLHHALKYARMMRRAFFSSRETCAWEIPISSATSICVFPSKKRREMISCSRALSFFNASDKDRCSTQFSSRFFYPESDPSHRACLHRL